jgi:hypothetical protein
VVCRIDVADSSLHGHAAEFRVIRKVVVHDSRPVNSQDVVFRRPIPSLQAHNEFVIHRASLQVFSYNGSKIDIEVHSELEIDDGLLFDTKITQEEQMMLSPRPAVNNNAKELVEPADAFDFVENLKAIPFHNQIITMALAIAGAVIIAVNSWVGIHDQFTPEPQVWFYDHRDSDGDSESPFFKSLMGSGTAGAAIWFAIRRQLKKYMTFELAGVPQRICRDDVLRAATLLRGRSRVALRDVTIRIVACNMEKGQYKRGSGTKERTVSFTEPVRAVVLFDKQVSIIPENVPVESHCDGEIRFEPMFKALYPPQQVGSSHGLSVYWEIQLIHDEFIDQELIGPVECFPWKDFLEA